MARWNGHGAQEASTSDRRRRLAIIVVLIALVALAIVGTFLVTNVLDDDSQPSPPASVSPP